jgi:hypothetical protein
MDEMTRRKCLIVRVNVLWSAGYSVCEIIEKLGLPKRFVTAAIEYGQSHKPS